MAEPVSAALVWGGMEAAAAASLASTLSTVATVASLGVTAFSAFSGGQATGSYYDAQGQMAQLQGRQQALAYRQQGVEALDRQIKLEAQINARGYAGGLDPFSGSTDKIAENNLASAIDEFDLSRQNAIIAEGMGGFQADIYKQAGASARRRGMLEAAGTLAGGALKLSSIGGEPSAKGTPKTNPSSWNYGVE
jgi:hypothetical protein